MTSRAVRAVSTGICASGAIFRLGSQRSGIAEQIMPRPTTLKAMTGANQVNRRPVVTGATMPIKVAMNSMARAFQAASLRGVPLIAVIAWDFGPYDAHNAELWQYSIEDMNKAMAGEARKVLEDSIAEFPEVEVIVKAVRGRPETALIEESRNAGLVVIGSKGRGGFTRLLLGSTSRHVLRDSFCPVVVTRDWAGWKDRSGRSR